MKKSKKKTKKKSKKNFVILPVVITGFLLMLPAIASAVTPAVVTFENTSFYGGSGDQKGTGIIYADGAVYTCGGMIPEGIGGNNGYLMEHSPDSLSMQWSRTFDYTTDFKGVALAEGVLAAAGKNTGLTSDPMGSTEVKTFLAGFENDGTDGPGVGDSLWATGGPGTLGPFFVYSGYEQFNALTSSDEGGMEYFYAAGRGQPGFNPNALVLAKYSSSGGYINAVTDNYPGVSFDSFSSLHGWSSGRDVGVMGGYIYTAGFSTFEEGKDRPVLWIHDSNLNQIIRQNNSAIVGRFNGVAVSEGVVYAVGTIINVLGIEESRDYLIEKFDAAGNRLWSVTPGGIDTDILTDVTVIDDRVFAVGYTESEGCGGSDAVIIEIDPANGDILSTTLFGGALDDLANAVCTDGESLFVAGASESFATPAGNTVGESEIIILKFGIDSEIPDTTPPEISTEFPMPDGNNGWFVTVPVNGSVNASDSSSVTEILCSGALLSDIEGLGTTCATGIISLTADGIYNISCTATDDSGNNATSPAAEVKIDTTLPEITITVPVAVADYIINEVIIADWSSADAISGIQSETGTVPSGSPVDTASAGPKVFTVTAEDMAGNVNIVHADYNVITQSEAVEEIIDYIESSGLSKGMKRSLTAKLENAIKQFDKGNYKAGVNLLNAFINEVMAQYDKKIDAAEADSLIAYAERIIDTLGV